MTITQKLVKLEIKFSTDHDHDKYIILKNPTSENVTAKLKQANLPSKSDLVSFVKKADFDNKLKNVSSYKSKLNELSKKVKAISTKTIDKRFDKKFSILNGSKYFSSITFQDYLVSIPAKRCIKYFSGITRIDFWKSRSEENI